MRSDAEHSHFRIPDDRTVRYDPRASSLHYNAGEAVGLEEGQDTSVYACVSVQFSDYVHRLLHIFGVLGVPFSLAEQPAVLVLHLQRCVLHLNSSIFAFDRHNFEPAQVDSVLAQNTRIC